MLKKINPLIIQSVLFLLTIFTTTLTGAFWVGILHPEDSFWDFFSRGFAYSIPFLGILTIHELGHYLTARYYKVNVTLPYYIPIFIPGLMPQIGTVGAFIKMNSRSASKKEIFDIGVAGPLAGFVAAIGLLFYGFTHLPQREHIFIVHKEYAEAEKKSGKPYENIVYTSQYMRERDSISYIESLPQDSIDFVNDSNTSLFSLSETKDSVKRVWKREPFKPAEKYEELA